MSYITFQPKDNFNTKLYSGNSSTQSITGIGFQPDWVWIKKRDGTDDHVLYDVVRGATKSLHSNTSEGEDTQTDGLTSFDSDGFSLGADGKSNQGHGYVSWNWKAANSQGSSNTDGSINTTYTSANTTAGFSISKYTGTASTATVGHGLGAVPKMIMVKNLSADSNWQVFHTGLTSNNYRIALDSTDAEGGDSTAWNNTDPTSSVFSVGTSFRTNGSGNSIIAYSFAEVKGFSKIGKYLGNGSANGPFIYTGFKPSFILIKRINSSASWVIVDNQRSNTFNPQDRLLFPNTNAAEDGSGETYFFDFLSNGVKIRTTSGSYGNASGDTYIYAAFAEQPLVSSNEIPATAR